MSAGASASRRQLPTWWGLRPRVVSPTDRGRRPCATERPFGWRSPLVMCPEGRVSSRLRYLGVPGSASRALCCETMPGVNLFDLTKTPRAAAVAALDRWTGLEPRQAWWQTLLLRQRPAWRRAVKQADGPAVVLGPSLGRHRWEVNLDAGLAIALTLRGARVTMLTCDEVLPACTPWGAAYDTAVNGLPDAPQDAACRACYPRSRSMFRGLGLPVATLGSLLTEGDKAEAASLSSDCDLAEVASLNWRGTPVGEHAVAGAIRFFASTELEAEPAGTAVLRRYVNAAALTVAALTRLMEQADPSCISCTHGIYVPHGLVGPVARGQGRRVVNWHRAYRKNAVIFSEGDTYHRTLLTEQNASWEQMPWVDSIDSDLMAYLNDRETGRRDWISFNPDPDPETQNALRDRGVDLTKPCVGLLTNVAWDAQLHYGATPFVDMFDWLVQTVEYFGRRRDVQLVVRVHPAEISGHVPSRQRAAKVLNDRVPRLPSNVFIIDADSPLSTYDAMAACDSAIIYATKTGIELSARGIPVIVAGEGWIKNKGFALDADSAAEYFELLDRLPLGERLGGKDLEAAKRYAFHFFFRRMIPLPFLTDSLLFDVDSLEELLPGHHPGLDVICDGILDGSPFVYPAEDFGWP